MPDNDPSESVENDPIQEESDAETVGPLPNGPHSQTAHPTPAQEMQREVHDIEDRVKWAERWMIGLTFAIAFFGLCSVGVGLLQWNAMSGQLGEMKSGGKDTHDLAVAATGQAQAAAISANAAKSAADTAVKALDDTRTSFALNQRPYLVADIPRFVRSPAVDGQPIAVSVTFKNIGKTPAIKRRTQVDLLRFRATAKSDQITKGIERYFKFIEGAFESLSKRADDPGGKYGPFAREDVAPGAEPFSTAVNNTPFTAEEVKDLPTGALALAFVGIIRYTDGFQRRY